MTPDDTDREDSMYKRIGCFADDKNDRVLGRPYKSDMMTSEVSAATAPVVKLTPSSYSLCQVTYATNPLHILDMCLHFLEPRKDVRTGDVQGDRNVQGQETAQFTIANHE